MKTLIKYLNYDTEELSQCGSPLDIQISSRDLNWKGVLIEKGHSPYFYPKNVITTNFYFALELENKYSWEVNENNESVFIHTEPGDIWINPPNAPFTHKVDVPCHFLIITIEPSTLFNFFDGTLPINKLIFLNNYNIQDSTIEYIFHMLLSETSNQGTNGHTYFENIMRLFSNYFIRNYSNYKDIMNHSNISSIISTNEMVKIDSYIDSHINEPITIDDLAHVLNVSKFHFLNEFKKFNNMTPYQYILSMKIQNGKRRLQCSNDQITLIAHQLGFSDSSHFTRTFKRITGITPAQYRKSRNT